MSDASPTKKTAAISSKTLAVLMLPALVLVLSQADLTAFPSGHHGWIASHTLANAAHTTPSNYMTGYTLVHAATPGHPAQPVYFNRAPFVGTAIIGIALHLTDDLVWQIRLSRLLSNLVVCAAFVLILLVLRDAGVPLPLALAACLWALSGHWVMRYRDMPSVDVWSLLSFALVARAAQPLVDGKPRQRRYWLVVIACSIGWGYATLVPLVVWACSDLLSALRRWRTVPLAGHRKALVHRGGGAALAIGLAVSGLYLGHITLAEAAVKDVAVSETGVWQSARKRLGFDPSFNNKTKHVRRDVVNVLSRRIAKSAMPQSMHQALGPSGRDVWRNPRWVAVLAVLMIGLLIGVSRGPPTHRAALLALGFGGLGWYAAMPNLSLHHDYVALSLLGPVAVSASGLLAVLKRFAPGGQWLVAALVAVSFGHANWQYNQVKQAEAARYNVVTDDFARVAQKLPKRAAVYYRQGYRGLTGEAPYKVGMYLPSNPIAARAEQAKFAITRYRKGPGRLLTPKNRAVFLYASQ